MAMTIGPAEGEEDEMMSAINTTPLVDVMLVLLIIFLITIPVVTHNVPVALPKEVNLPTQTKPENINLAVDRDGQIFWDEQLIARSEGPAGTHEKRLRADAPARGAYPRRPGGPLRVHRQGW